jgi:acyl transferase domain-containing protein
VAQLVEGMVNVQIANYNSPEQVVLSGSNAEIATVEKILTTQGYQVTPLPVSAAFHTAFVRHASQPFANALDQVTFYAPQLPVYANLTAAPYPKDLAGMRQLLEAQLLNPVQFVQQIENIYGQGGYCFVEIGPRQILTNLVKQILGDRPHFAIALNPSRQKDSDVQLCQGVIQLRVLGLALNDLETAPLTVKTPSSKRKGMTLKLNATNYISDKTKALMESALQPDLPVKIEPSVDSQNLESQREEVKGLENEEILSPLAPVTPSPSDSHPLTEEIHQTHSPIVSQDQPVTMTMNNTISNNMNHLLEAFYQHQQNFAKVHEEYIKHQSHSFQSFLQLLQQKEMTAVEKIDGL